jgi:hypothetical protein
MQHALNIWLQCSSCIPANSCIACRCLLESQANLLVAHFLTSLLDITMAVTTHPALCSQVTAESLDLHYFSNRPGLWPIVVGVLKGLSNDYFKLDLQVRGGVVAGLRMGGGA